MVSLMTNSDNPPDDDNSFFRKRQYGPGRGQGRGQGRGMGRGRGRGRGRPPVAYPIDIPRRVSRTQGVINLTSFELKLLQLSDIKELTQLQIAEQLNISQTSVWRYLKAIRTKIADAISLHSHIEFWIAE